MAHANIEAVREKARGIFQQNVERWREAVKDRLDCSKNGEAAAKAFREEAERAVRKGFEDPAALKGLATCSPVECDLFDAYRFAAAVKRDTVTGEVLDEQTAQYAPAMPLALGVYAGLFNPDAAPNEETPGLPWDAAHAEICEAMRELPEYVDLSKITAFNPITTAAMLPQLLPVVVQIAKKQQEEQGNRGGDEPGLALTEADIKALREALTAAKADGEQVNDAARSCGFKTHFREDADPAPYLELAKAFKDETVRRMVNALGRLKRTAEAASKRLIQGFAGRGARYGIGEDVTKLPDWAVADLAVPELEFQVYAQLAAGEAPQVYERDYAPAGRGPIVLCVDSSSSMDGALDGGYHSERASLTRYDWAMATAVSTLQVAEHFGRKTHIIEFQSHAREFDGNDPKQVAAFLRTAPGGCTNFEAALTLAVGAIKKHRRLRNADILFLTDGEAHVSEDFRERFLRWKRQTSSRLFLVNIGRGEAEASGIAWAADHAVSVAKLLKEGHDIGEAFIPFWEAVGAAPERETVEVR